MNYSKKHCKQIAYRLVRAKFYPKTSADVNIVLKTFFSGISYSEKNMAYQAYKSTAYHYSRNKKIYRW